MHFVNKACLDKWIHAYQGVIYNNINILEWYISYMQQPCTVHHIWGKWSLLFSAARSNKL